MIVSTTLQKVTDKHKPQDKKRKLNDEIMNAEIKRRRKFNFIINEIERSRKKGCETNSNKLEIDAINRQILSKVIDDPELKDGLVNLKAVDGIKYSFYKNAIDFGSFAMIIEIITLANEHNWLKHQLLKAPITEDGMTFFQYSGYIGAVELMEAILDIACMDTFEWVNQAIKLKSISTFYPHQINSGLMGDSQFIYEESFLSYCLAEDDLSPEHREKVKKIQEDIIQVEY